MSLLDVHASVYAMYGIPMYGCTLLCTYLMLNQKMPMPVAGSDALS